MPSLKSKLFNFLIINRHLFRGKLSKPLFDDTTSIADFRDLCEKSASRYAKIPAGITVKQQIIESMGYEWLILITSGTDVPGGDCCDCGDCWVCRETIGDEVTR